MTGSPKTAQSKEQPNWPQKQTELFEWRYAELLKLRAELATYELGDDVDDHKHFEITLRIDDAERLVMTTHASYAADLWLKIAVFEHALHGSPDSSEDRIDNKKVWMFGCIKADLMRHGIGRSE